MRFYFGPKIKHPDEHVRMKALARLQDEDLLVEVAASDSAPAVRLAAARRIQAPSRLVELVDSAKSMDVILDAVGRIEDSNLLAKIILDHKNLQIMNAAFEGITEPKILEDIAQDDRYSIQARRLAIDNYADQAFMDDMDPKADGTSGATDKKHRKPEGKELNEENIRALLEQYGPDKIADAMGKFRGSDRAVRSLGLIARSNPEENARALHYLDKALEHSNPHIRTCALREVASLPPGETVDTLLSKLKNDPDPNVREAYEQLPSR